MALKAVRVAANITITGDKRLMRTMRSMSEKMQKKILLSAVRKVSRPIVTAARAKAPEDSGALKKAMGVKAKKYAHGAGSTIAVIGARSKVSERKTARGSIVKTNPAKTSHLVEFGTAPHSLTEGVNMKAIRRGKSVFSALAEKAFSLMGRDIGTETKAYREKSRTLAREYLYRRDKAAGRNVHPGAKPQPFLGPVWDARITQTLANLGNEIWSAIRRLAKAA